MSINNIEDYLEELRSELKGSDPATLQDALSDAEDHLYLALESARAEDLTIKIKDALSPIIEAYGSPAETASAYREIESRIFPTLSSPTKKPPKAKLQRYFAIFSDPIAWGSSFYLIISMLIGFMYFSWIVLGFATSITFAITIFALPIAVYIIQSVNGLSLFEGRIIEALLGVPMPRRSLFSNEDLPWQERLKKGLADKNNRRKIRYLMFQMPLGILYAAIFGILFGPPLAMIVNPITQTLFDISIVQFGGLEINLPGILLPPLVISGILLLPASMYLAKRIGKLHAGYAKKMLISK